MKHIIRFSIFFLLAAFFLGACSPQQSIKNDRFELVIFKQVEGLDVDQDQDIEHVQTVLKAADKKNALFVIGTDQIDEYNWDLQTITLTKEATNQLLDEIERWSPINFSSLMNANLSGSFRFAGNLARHPFVVTADNRFKYGGIFIYPPLQFSANLPWQWTIDYPVILASLSDDNRAVFAIRPNGRFQISDPISENEDLRKFDASSALKPEMRQTKLFPGLQTTFSTYDSSIDFHKLLYDKTIKSILKLSGKLK